MQDHKKNIFSTFICPLLVIEQIKKIRLMSANTRGWVEQKALSKTNFKQEALKVHNSTDFNKLYK